MESAYDFRNSMYFINMKKTVWACVLAAALPGLSGCMPSMAMFSRSAENDLRILETSGEGFGALLAQEYQNLAVLEDEFMNDPDAAAHYAAKAAEAARGVTVWPDNPTSFKFPAAKADDLAARYNMVLDALEMLASEENANLLALAQTRYDCWLERAAEGRDEAEVSICRDMVVKALGMMSVPPGRRLSYTVTFPDDETLMDEESMAVIEQAAQNWPDRPHWEVLLVGHTAAGHGENDKRISMRRAVAVRNALAQQGVDPDKVAIVAHTDTDRETAIGASLQVDIRFEPSYLMKEGPLYDSLEALGEEY
jgi:outer membrane protein OmpA-like peptidoglycan-associated protein